MKLRLISLSGLCAALACASLNAAAVGQLADVSVIDRDSGQTLPVYQHRGEYWVAGKPGARYSVSVSNRLGQRVLAVPSVDGVNAISGETAAWGQSGYVFGPYDSYQITGWRKSNSEVAAFEFASAEQSYAGQTGRPGSIGVIGVALFRERVAPPPVVPAVPGGWQGEERGDASDSTRREARSAAPAAAAPTRPAPTAAAPSGLADAPAAATANREREARSAHQSAHQSAAEPAAKLGTAHGARETSVVSQTRFERQQRTPNEVVRIRYDSRENLIASGVIQDRQAFAPIAKAPNAFPKSPDPQVRGFVPDPPRH